MGIYVVLALLSINISYGEVIPNWSENAELPGPAKCEIIHDHKICLTSQNRKNIYKLDLNEMDKVIEAGAKHVLQYPVAVTRMRLPKKAMDKFFDGDSRSPIRRFIFKVAKKITNFESFSELFDWIGLHEFPKTQAQEGPNLIPFMGELEKYHMGVTEFNDNGHKSLTFSCAACHSSNLFGTKVIGLTNRFPKANEIFILGKKALSKVSPLIFRLTVGTNKQDYDTYKITKEAMKYVRLKPPVVLGLDTSLAQVGLSLAKRGLDPYAQKVPNQEVRKSGLDIDPADSKPAVWWNLKYKTRWLSDGSIASGNPVHTNFLWNEVGRGVDLKELEDWLNNNKKKVKELTAYVFNTEAPKYNDYFPEDINIRSAKRGEKLFLKSCKGCHGVYDKGWSQQNINEQSYAQKIATTKVWYHKKTPVIDIKTDMYRANGMKYFYKDLNRLQISKSINTVVEPQTGYVPPPLVGIWARWPYFHNNSAPTLYDVITPPKLRPKSYIAVPAEDKRLDFDKAKNGYPMPQNIREPWKSDKEYFYDTSKRAMSNQGHRRMLFDKNGDYKFSEEDKLDIVQFLKTL